jgi:hypothetical protein
VSDLDGFGRGDQWLRQVSDQYDEGSMPFFIFELSLR